MPRRYKRINGWIEDEMDKCESELVMKRVSLKETRPFPFALRALSLWLACMQAVLPVSNELLAAGARVAAPTTVRPGEAPRSEGAPPDRPQVTAFLAEYPPPHPYPSFSAHPSDGEFFQAPILGEPLVPMSGPKRASE